MNIFHNDSETDIQSITTEELPKSENFTDDADMTKPQLRLAFDVIVIFCMLSIMFAMGCEVTIKEIMTHFRKPSVILIGMVSQFFILPLLGFLAIKIFVIEGVYATSILIMSCSPGGGYSNLITYLSKGDVSLSVAMTTVSNVLALGFTPLNVWIYSHGVVTGDIKIPFKQMSISMFVLSAILACGIILRWKFPRSATVVTKVGVICSGLLAVACGVLALVLYPKFFQNIPWFLFCAVAFIGPLGLILAYCLAFITKFKERIRRTIAIESAVQNVGTAITIVIISFSKSALQEMSVYIILYAGLTTVIMLVLASGLAVYDHFNGKNDLIDSTNKDKEFTELAETAKIYAQETSAQK